MKDDFSLNGRVALITGAGRNVGREIALHFARHDAGGIVINDIQSDLADEVVAEVAALGVKAMAAPYDIRDRAALKNMFKTSYEKFGRLDVLVNNAGPRTGPLQSWDEMKARKKFWEQDPEDWQLNLDIVFTAVLHCCHNAIPLMIEGGRGGSIINIVSDAASQGVPGMEVYGACRAGTAGLLRGLARGLGRYNITCNSISLGSVRGETARKDGVVDQDGDKTALSYYVIRRFGEPADVAGLSTLLASEAGTWFTGQTFNCDGGYVFSQG